MSIFHYGPPRDWFAWHPVRTDNHGWKWLTTLTRYQWHADIPGAPTGWGYKPKEEQ